MAQVVGEVSTTQFSGWFKEIYVDKGVVDLIPNATPIQKEVPFSESSLRLGNKFHQPVVVAEESGFTYAAPNSGAFAINTPVAMATQDAQVDGYQLLLASRMDYETAARASSSKAAFGDSTGLQVNNMLASARRRLEMLMLYGQTGLGKTTSVSSANVDSVTETCAVTAATFGPLIWSGRKGAKIIFYDGTTPVASGNSFTVKAVSIANKTITVTGASGDITSLNTAVTNAAKNLDIYWAGAVSGTGTLTFAEPPGIDKIVTNTTGTMFNIDCSQYDLFAGNTYDCLNGSLTLQKIVKAASLAVGRGLDEDVTVYVNPDTWTNLSTDQAALRKYNAAGGTAENGFEAIKFYHMNVTIAIQGHGMVKGGEAFMLPMKHVRRVGAQDVSFQIPGKSSEQIFLELPSNAGYEYRVYSHQAIFIETPAKCVKLVNIVNA